MLRACLLDWAASAAAAAAMRRAWARALRARIAALKARSLLALRHAAAQPAAAAAALRALLRAWARAARRGAPARALSAGLARVAGAAAARWALDRWRRRRAEAALLQAAQARRRASAPCAAAARSVRLGLRATHCARLRLRCLGRTMAPWHLGRTGHRGASRTSVGLACSSAMRQGCPVPWCGAEGSSGQRPCLWVSP